MSENLHIPPPPNHPPLRREPPLPPVPGQAALSHEETREALKVPSLLLMVIAALSFLMTLPSFFAPTWMFDLMGQTLENMAGSSPEIDQLIAQLNAMQATNLASALIFGILGLVTYAFVIVGSLKMLKVQSYGLAMTACVLSSIPCYGSICCLGMVPGIWGLVLLAKPEIRAAFNSASG